MSHAIQQEVLLSLISHRIHVRCVSTCNNTDSFDANHVVETNRQTSSLVSSCSKDETGASALLGIALSSCR